MKTKTKVIMSLYGANELWKKIMENSTKHWGKTALRHRNRKGAK